MKIQMSSIVLIAAIVAIAGPARATADRADTRQVVCAGGSEVFVVNVAAAERGSIEKTWSWTAETDETLPLERHKWFRNLDECKPIDGGKRMLVCASNSGCGLIDRATGKLQWMASVTNAHSLELLPGKRIAVASSLGGDRLVLFDLQGASAGEPVFKTPLRSAHGLVWDDKRQTLWALGYDELRAYKLADWQTMRPSLELAVTHTLPDPDGHDLRPVPASNDLLLTTGADVFLFDRDAEKFRRHPSVGTLAKVKAIDVCPESERIVYSTWGPEIKLLTPDARVMLKGQIVYKVRWFDGADGAK